MVTFANRAKQVTATTGTGSITLGSAVGGYQTFASAGATGTVRYTIEDGDAWEIGSGAISGSTLSRTLDESSTGALLNLSGSAIVFVTAAAEDIQQPPAEGAFANGDKTKLDGIEASADVTDPTNVTAAGALMDSEVTNLAQVKAFDSTDYATSTQGTTADSAVQPADLATVATTGAYSDLSGLPTLGTAAATDATAYATASQGSTADAALPKTGGAMTGDIVVKGVTETNFALSGTTPAIDPTNGTIQTWTLSGASTPTFAAGWSANEGITMMINDGSASAITWPAMQWAGGSAPTLPTTGYGVVTIWKEGSVYYGVSAGDMS
tara:strand:- start:5849 stop:6820 length:972 start_codon:yes stop_codon:yes gene_type:complete